MLRSLRRPLSHNELRLFVETLYLQAIVNPAFNLLLFFHTCLPTLRPDPHR